MSEETPLGWSCRSLDSVASACLGKMLDRSKNRGEPQPYLRNINVRWFGFDLSNLLTMRFESDERDRFGVRLGDVMICEGGEPGRAAVWRETRPMLFQKAVHRVRCGAELDPDFLVFQLRHHADSGSLGAGFTGSTIKHLTGRALKSHVLVFPQIDEQRRIVSRLRDLHDRARRAREALADVPQLADRLRQSVLDAALRGDLTSAWRDAHPDTEPASALLERVRMERRRRLELAPRRTANTSSPPIDADAEELPELPATWTWVRVDELFWDAGYGTSQRCTPDGAGPPVLRIPNVAGRALDLGDLKYATDPISLDPTGAVTAGDFLFVRTNGSRDLIGRGCYVKHDLPREHHFASYLIRMRLVPVGVLGEWLSLMWCGPHGRRQILAESKSSAGQFNLSLSAARRFLFPLPPEEEMKEAVVAANRLIRSAEALMEVHRRVGDDLDVLSRSILAKAFRGELATSSVER